MRSILNREFTRKKTREITWQNLFSAGFRHLEPLCVVCVRPPREITLVELIFGGFSHLEPLCVIHVNSVVSRLTLVLPLAFLRSAFEKKEKKKRQKS